MAGELNLNCPLCNKVISVDITPAQYVHGNTSTVMVLEHSGEVDCDCGKAVVPTLFSVQGLTIGLRVIPDEMRKKKILTPRKGIIQP